MIARLWRTDKIRQRTVSKSFSLTRLFDVSYARALGGSKDDKAGGMDGWCKEEATMRAKGKGDGGCRRAGRRSKRGRIVEEFDVTVILRWLIPKNTDSGRIWNLEFGDKECGCHVWLNVWVSWLHSWGVRVSVSRIFIRDPTIWTWIFYSRHFDQNCQVVSVSMYLHSYAIRCLISFLWVVGGTR